MSSVSKQKRLAKKAAKNSKKPEETPDVNGSSTNKETIENSTAAAANGLSLETLKISGERTATGVLASQPRSRDIKIEQYSLSFYGRVLVDNATIELNFGRRYGLIGANGSGKSTFLASLAAREAPIPEHIDIYLLNQEAEPCDLNAIDYVILAAKSEITRLEKEVEDILAEAEGAEDLRLEDLYDRINALDESTFKSRASTLLHGLGFSQEMMAKKTRDMSGGWRMRVALAKALFIKPTLLLLDEPTNHLDLEACVWLEEYLKNYNRILLLVSHSQDFLDGVCNETMHLTEKKKLNYYGGGYSSFVKTKAEMEVNQMKAYHKQQEEIAHIKKFIASAGTYANLVKQAKSKQKIIDKMEAAGLIEKVEPPITFKFKFENVEKLPPPVLQFDQVSFSYSGSSKTVDLLYKDLDLAVDLDSRVALVGPNGVGKSTLLKLMMGEIQPVKGRIARHTNLKLAKYSQHSADQLDMDLSPINYMRKNFAHLNGDIDFWRSQIGRYGLTGIHQTNAIKTLSDGLKSRLVFAELVLSKPDIVLMDEPTNHLDMESIDGLAKAIKEYSGGVVLVSHDFRLISQVANDIWLCKDKKVTTWKGTIEEYKKYLAKGVKI
ncbi:P-loop containing nucleoside triphosphate hydrolase protein [Rhizophagus irregularis]|uniref:P-loop containing nucleoside triphosphate hydrolase protein n=3 Tax=Rhizophagus irregularis TaxID=588596 RepID=A0A2I1E960_9GLOM|nr:putative ATP-binding cassette (ABC) transporter [Rhizophagus irregularis DAOM 181602=DAOM 197198]EXX55776.1 ATP-binding cassette family ATPase ARB1 [Rhizophagus irregularis DAOM 197198w]PKC13080.1 P-loop containing nucleoside triphosphate hydrolase protein [Rhizophagus irregularis]PKC66230.1 P-loop containing nucleoside triphosphate hydrolase protein [Rhizophagus irregularis]PKY18674.1 P-loop containing nucleoside triphosphate hydrolase protein [Rhizophagus irregularis]POG60440.1 putative A|eukprot:XP_025167306.1 putative ATP-binding cassette (ABC) transporter [Rhizophagus irregularis DAOM 181602=DAOM 197198]